MSVNRYIIRCYASLAALPLYREYIRLHIILNNIYKCIINYSSFIYYIYIFFFSSFCWCLKCCCLHCITKADGQDSPFGPETIIIKVSPCLLCLVTIPQLNSCQVGDTSHPAIMKHSWNEFYISPHLGRYLYW